MSTESISFSMDISRINWQEMKKTLQEDNFDNGRSPELLKESFENSYAACVSYTGTRIIGTARALSDGVCNAYIVDVWTLSEFRNQGIARMMMGHLMDKLPGQHVYLFTESATEFYRKLGFNEQGTGLGKVVGRWLDRSAAAYSR